MTWVQLDRHTKPVLIANIGGFWKPLLALFAHMREAGFVRSGAEIDYLVAERAVDILPMIREAQHQTLAAGSEKLEVSPRL